ncbi:MAG: carboxypeptidase-like regulatory domain-containing protein [Aureispira sp.]|nr:carboxypeptidase-like regulatory domain-containing protein [Aureispira sp.]
MQYSYILYTFLFVLGCSSLLQATHITGKIVDDKGEALPFASIYVQGSSIGTTTNVDGVYDLELKEGDYNIVFQYVGFQQKVQKVSVDNKDIILNIQLNPIATEIGEITVTAGEDPAYRIIRKAIKKRKFYLNQVKSYTCDAYVKGTQHIKNLPKQIMGQSLEEFRKGLDSTGSGIIYLSESVAELYYEAPRNFKEVMISSKVSGNDNGFSFNSGTAMHEISFYRSHVELGDTKLLSPIANGALAAYKYELVTTFLDDNDKVVYKIKVIPRNELGQVFRGYIYIVDEDWAIHSTELYTTGKSANISVLDTVLFKQVHVFVQDSIRQLFSQDITFQIKALGIRTEGNFLGVFRNYDVVPAFGDKFFGAEIVKIEEEANKKDSIYWNKVRPVPLTPIELKEYKTKDSLQKIWKSKEYLDSMDRKRNRPSWTMIFMGYTYQKSHKRIKLSIPSPLTTVRYNTVQGYSVNLNVTFTKEFDEDRTSWFDVQGVVGYGFSDKQVRGHGRFRYKLNSITGARLHVEGGRKLRQFTNREPIQPLINTFYSLLGKCNYAKFYDDYYGQIRYSQRVYNGIFLRADLSYGQRRSLINHSTHSWVKRDQEFYSNQPLDFDNPPLDNQPSFNTHEYLQFDLYMRFRFGQKYISYPKQRFYTASKWPDIWLHYRRGIPLLGGDTNFDYLAMTIAKDDLAIGSAGLFSFRARGAWFPYVGSMEFIDYRHINGNQTILAKPDAYLRTFQLLPYYQWSTNQWFASLHVEHDFNGYIWNKIPLLKHLGFEFVTGFHFLYTPENKEYMEFTLGLDRIGFGLFRFMRVDAVMNYQIGERPQFGAVIGINLSL